MDILRFCILGNIDDGKSTLIGRLLYDTGTLKEDQVARLKNYQNPNGMALPDFSSITDGLFDEQLQKITIDVAYQYFQTPKRKFIIADTPGHLEFTRNMATGASVSDACIVMIDASRGIAPQTKRHCAIASILGIKKWIFCVNKMDLVDYDESVFSDLKSEIEGLKNHLHFDDVHLVPVSATLGQNLVRVSDKMPWYKGKTIMAILEEIGTEAANKSEKVRMPVQFAKERFVFGTLENGTLQVGDEIVLLPESRVTRIKSIYLAANSAQTASPGSAVTLEMDETTEYYRGQMIVGQKDIPLASTKISAKLIWLANGPGEMLADYTLLHNTAKTTVQITKTHSEFDVTTMHPNPFTGNQLKCNGIYDTELHCQTALFYDRYSELRNIGSFILCDPQTNHTVAAGMLC